MSFPLAGSKLRLFELEVELVELDNNCALTRDCKRCRLLGPGSTYRGSINSGPVTEKGIEGTK